MSDRPPTTRPTGLATPITLTWQGRVRAELERRGWDQQELAKKIRCSEGAITGLLKPGARTSRLVALVNAALDIAPPEYVDDIDQEMHDIMKALRDGNRAAFDRHLQEGRREVRELHGTNPDSNKPRSK